MDDLRAEQQDQYGDEVNIDDEEPQEEENLQNNNSPSSSAKESNKSTSRFLSQAKRRLAEKAPANCFKSHPSYTSPVRKP